MRTVSKILSDGINTVADLQESLLLAAQLEFSTIPPYLCALWSINSANGGDPNGVTGIIHSIVVQEMLHMGFALNMLVSIGGQPEIATQGFVPTYPTNGLPGNVHPGLVVSLEPLSAASLQTFLTIELPEKGPIALAMNSAEIFPTIGDFYDAISTAFTVINPPFTGPVSKQVVTTIGPDQLFGISAVADAVNAINEIKDQGEGTTSTPFEANFDPTEFAHYYAFKEIATGHKLQEGPDGVWRFNGPAVAMPTVFPFQLSSDPNVTEPFNIAISDILRLLQTTWTSDPSTINTAIGNMFSLTQTAMALIKQQITPPFLWTDKTNLTTS